MWKEYKERLETFLICQENVPIYNHEKFLQMYQFCEALIVAVKGYEDFFDKPFMKMAIEHQESMDSLKTTISELKSQIKWIQEDFNDLQNKEH